MPETKAEHLRSKNMDKIIASPVCDSLKVTVSLFIFQEIVFLFSPQRHFRKLRFETPGATVFFSGNSLYFARCSFSMEKERQSSLNQRY